MSARGLRMPKPDGFYESPEHFVQTKRVNGPTDWERVVLWFREHPGSSVQEVRFGLFISNVTGRMSDARKHGVEFVQWRDADGTFRYRIAESRPVLRGDQTSLGLGVS